MGNTFNAADEAELRLCATNFFHFCDNYVKVFDGKAQDYVPLKLYDFQKRLIEDIQSNRFVIGTKFRQGGFTDTITAWLVWNLLFKTDMNMMALTHWDRAASIIIEVARGVIEHLPDFLKPNLKKLSGHEIICGDTGSKLMAFTPEACCGRAIDILYIEEPAFHRDFEPHWKAMYPCISCKETSQCVVIGTPNGTGNWFHEVYKKAKAQENSFHVYQCDYAEHPAYNTPAWAVQMQQQLGFKGFQQEVLQQFLEPEKPAPKEVLNNKFQKVLDFLLDVTDEEAAEFLDVRRGEFERKSEEKKKLRDELKKKEIWHLRSNPGPFELIYAEGDDKELCEDFGPPFCTIPDVRDREFTKNVKPFNLSDHDSDLLHAVNHWEMGWTSQYDYDFKPESKKEEPYKPTAHQFERLTREQVKEKFATAHKGWKASDTKHPEFASPAFRTAEELADLFSALGDDEWTNRLKKERHWWKKIEDNIDWYCCDPDMLCLAGVISTAEKALYTNPHRRPDLEILNKVQEERGLQKGLNLSFLGGTLCVNEVATTIKEEDVSGLYTGYSALTSHREAVDLVVKLLTEKLKPLFGAPEPAVESK